MPTTTTTITTTTTTAAAAAVAAAAAAAAPTTTVTTTTTTTTTAATARNCQSQKSHQSAGFQLFFASATVRQAAKIYSSVGVWYLGVFILLDLKLAGYSSFKKRACCIVGPRDLWLAIIHDD